jgi:hypothetical protein
MADREEDDVINVENNDQVPVGGHTTLAFKEEQSKVPQFFSQKVKGTISALDFMRRINDLARTNNWSDNVTYNNFANVLRGVARKWLFSIVYMLDYNAD